MSTSCSCMSDCSYSYRIPICSMHATTMHMLTKTLSHLFQAYFQVPYAVEIVVNAQPACSMCLYLLTPGYKPALLEKPDVTNYWSWVRVDLPVPGGFDCLISSVPQLDAEGSIYRRRSSILQPELDVKIVGCTGLPVVPGAVLHTAIACCLQWYKLFSGISWTTKCEEHFPTSSRIYFMVIIDW